VPPTLTPPQASPPLSPPAPMPPGAPPSVVKSSGGTLIGSPMVPAHRAARVGCGGVTGHTTDQQTIRVDEVRLLPPRNHLLGSETKIGEANVAGARCDSTHTYWEDTHMKAPKRHSYAGAPPPRDSMRTTPLSWPWQPRGPISTVGLERSRIGELILSTQVQCSTPMS
jgi:hypothetical protein